MADQEIAETPRVAVDGRLMYYRKAGIAQYTRHLVTALSQITPATLTLILDRRDRDTAWVPPSVHVIRTVTPAHHRYEHITLPLELAISTLRVQSPISHFHLLHSPDFITARGRFRKVITIHDLYFMEHPEVMSADGARYYGRAGWSARQANHIIAVSDFTRREILRLLPHIPPHKITVIHEAANEFRVPSSEFRDSPPPTPHPLLPTPYALFVGTFEPRKNLVTLLRALRDLPTDLNLVIVGETGWGDSEPARLAAELGIAQRVTFAGRLSDEALDATYRAARMVVLPSLSEGFGLPVLEAMTRSVPVVCSNAGSLPEVAGDAALLHDPLDAVALARLMRMMWVSNAVHADYARRGLQHAAQFSWSRAAQETMDVYRNCERQGSKT